MSISTPNNSDEYSSRPAKRTRVLIACSRCKRRRQKCDNAIPACSNCARSNSDCTYPNQPTSYVHHLEDRVGMLEARLRSVDPHHASDESTIRRDGLRESIATPASIPSQDFSPPATSSGHLATGIGLLSSCAAAEPHYFGFSSGLTLAHFLEAAIAPSNGTSGINLPSLADRPFSKQIPTAQTPSAPVPTDRVGAKYVTAYLANVQPLYPFMDENELWRIHGNVTGNREERQNLDLQTRADLARLHLVYAIGSRCIQLIKPRSIEKHLPEGHLMAAMQLIPDILKFTSIHAVEITLLLALHSMRSPSGASVWHLCGFAMRQCLELGLHRPKPSPATQDRLGQQRRRLFWSVYIFERKSALVLGRPFAVSDKDIEVPMPDDISANATSLALHRHYIRLYQIHSKIRSTLHRLKCGAPHEQVEHKVAACLQRLESWKHDIHLEISSREHGDHGSTTAIPMPQGDSSDSGDDGPVNHVRSAKLDKTELLLEYFKACRSLLQPLLTESGHYTPSLADYRFCADASGQICQHYRQLHRLSALPFTLRDLHAVVVAGFTSIYCIMARPSLYDARRASEIGACSIVLYVIAEQWKSAKRYRDAFDAVADRLAELISTAQTNHEQNEPRSTFIDEQAATTATETISFEADHQLRQPETHDNFLEASFATFDMDYYDDDLRSLLATEGLDWFLNDQGS